MIKHEIKAFRSSPDCFVCNRIHPGPASHPLIHVKALELINLNLYKQAYWNVTNISSGSQLPFSISSICACFCRKEKKKLEASYFDFSVQKHDHTDTNTGGRSRPIRKHEALKWPVMTGHHISVDQSGNTSVTSEPRERG